MSCQNYFWQSDCLSNLAILYGLCMLDSSFFIDYYCEGVCNKHCLLSFIFFIYFSLLMYCLLSKLLPLLLLLFEYVQNSTVIYEKKCHFSMKFAHFQAVARVNRFKTVSCYSSIEVMLLFTFSMTSMLSLPSEYRLNVYTHCMKNMLFLIKSNQKGTFYHVITPVNEWKHESRFALYIIIYYCLLSEQVLGMCVYLSII